MGKTAGLITDTLHMPRVQYLFKQTFAPRQLEFRPRRPRGLLQDYWRRRRYLRLSKFLLREAGAWAKAGAGGVGEIKIILSYGNMNILALNYV